MKSPSDWRLHYHFSHIPTVKPGSHGVVKWARALPISESVVIITTCELMVVRVVVVHTLEKYGHKSPSDWRLHYYFNHISTVKPGSHVVVKWARAISESIVIITTCELMVVKVVVVYTLDKYGRETFT